MAIWPFTVTFMEKYHHALYYPSSGRPHPAIRARHRAHRIQHAELTLRCLADNDVINFGFFMGWKKRSRSCFYVARSSRHQP